MTILKTDMDRHLNCCSYSVAWCPTSHQILGTPLVIRPTFNILTFNIIRDRPIVISCDLFKDKLGGTLGEMSLSQLAMLTLRLGLILVVTTQL